MNPRDVRLLFQPAGLPRFARPFRRGHADSHPAPARVHRAPGVVKRSALLVVALFLAACRGPVQPYEALAPQVANLRAQFNRDTGKVRIVILPAPT